MKMALLRTILIGGITLSLILIGLAAAGDAGAGKTVFTNRCKMCHGADGKGNPAMARMLKVEFQAMDSEYVQTKTDSEIREVIVKGKGKMAAVRGLTDEQLADVIAFLRSLKTEE
jgi:mono/diheme cytochrome c family protein